MGVYKPAASADDCYEVVEALQADGNYCQVGYVSDGTLGAGFRFSNVTVPKDAEILTAFVTFQAYDSQSGTTCNMNIKGENADDPSIFSTWVDFEGRSRTAAVSWSAEETWTANSDYDTPSIVSIISTITSRAGWVSGQHIVIFVEDNSSSASAIRRPQSYDYSNTNCARLTITYTGESTASASVSPSASPSLSPSSSVSPSASPSGSPSVSPSPSPSLSPSASVSPSASPSGSPSISPSSSPSKSPSPSPSESPSISPSLSPSVSPSVSPSGSPSPSPSVSPSVSPSGSPSASPSVSPSLSPSASVSPSVSPSSSPSHSPSPSPSLSPSASISPSRSPSASPSISPSSSPSLSPSPSPSKSPSISPSSSPSVSQSPSISPSSSPSRSPSPSPSVSPSPDIEGEFIEPMMVMTGTSIHRTQSSGEFVFPIITMVDGTPRHSRGTFAMPLEIVEGNGRVSAITDIYRGVVMNLNNQVMSTYSNYPYNSLAYFNGKYLGMRSNGIYELGGDRDGTTQILSRIKTGPMDFGTNLTKYIRDVWITFRSDGHIALVFSVDEDNATQVEEFTKKASIELREEKIKVPRGLRGRYYTIELKNRSGADFDIDSMSVLVDVIGRKR